LNSPDFQFLGWSDQEELRRIEEGKKRLLKKRPYVSEGQSSGPKIFWNLISLLEQGRLETFLKKSVM
jgi:hypothetical protein